MIETYKNLLIVLSAMVFMVIFWSYQEITKSQGIIDHTTSFAESTRRGKSDAYEAFKTGSRSFHYSWSDTLGYFAPGVAPDPLQDEIDGARDAGPHFSCGIGKYRPTPDKRLPEFYALHVNRHHHDAVYLHTYNTEMARLFRNF